MTATPRRWRISSPASPTPRGGISAPFALWYAQAGTPEVTVTGSYDARERSYRLELAQIVPPTPGQPVKQPAIIPLKLGLVGPDGARPAAGARKAAAGTTA